MRKVLVCLLLLVSFIFVSPVTIDAALLVVSEGGNVVWNVLSEDYSADLEIPESESIEVARVSGEDLDERIKLQKEDGKVSLLTQSGSGEKKLDLDGIEEDVLEIEERPEVQKVVVSIVDGNFSFKQKGVSAVTEYPVNIDPRQAKVSLSTPTGEQYLSILPYDAYSIVVRSRLISEVTDNRSILIEEEEGLLYLFKGDKVFNLLNIYKHKIPVEMKLSASTGEIVAVDSPTWFKLIKFLYL